MPSMTGEDFDATYILAGKMYIMVHLEEMYVLPALMLGYTFTLPLSPPTLPTDVRLYQRLYTILLHLSLSLTRPVLPCGISMSDRRNACSRNHSRERVSLN